MSWSPLKPFCIIYFNDKAKVEKPTFVGIYGPALISRVSTERNFRAQTIYSAPMCVCGWIIGINGMSVVFVYKILFCSNIYSTLWRNIVIRKILF